MVFSIALDGPSGAGKSSLAAEAAKRLHIHYLDTGAMYRCLALAAEREGVSPEDERGIEALLSRTKIDVVFGDAGQENFLNGEAVGDEIRRNNVSPAASRISSYPAVREKLAEDQRRLAQKYSMIIDGRDIGTYVLPEAPCKIFLTARPEVRAERRRRQLEEKGVSLPFDQVLRELEARDAQDSNRALAPLRRAEDAVLLDSSELDFESTVRRVCELARERGLNHE